MSEENKVIVRRMIDELLNGQGNLDVADELFAPDYVGHNPDFSADVPSRKLLDWPSSILITACESFEEGPLSSLTQLC
jgi:hypothetical protein